MKKNVSLKVRIIVIICIFIPFLLLTFVFLTFVISGLNTYSIHRGSLLYQTDFCFSDDFGNVYFSFMQKCFKYKDGLNYEMAFFDNYNRPFLKKAVANENYIYLSQIDTNNRYVLSILDKGLNQVKQHYFLEAEEIMDIAEKNEIIYCLLNNKETNQKILMEIKPFENDDAHQIAIVTEKTSTFEHNGTIISVDTRTHENQLMLSKDKTLFTYLWFNDLAIGYDGNQVTIKYKNDSFSIQKELSFNRLYRKKYLIGSTLLFGMYENIDIKKCGNKSTICPCICSLGRSRVYSFDLISKELKMIREYEEGTFLIDYDLNQVNYYLNGGLYIDDIMVKSCEIIKEGELEKVHFQGYFTESEAKNKYYLSFFNGEFYGI